MSKHQILRDVEEIHVAWAWNRDTVEISAVTTQWRKDHHPPCPAITLDRVGMSDEEVVERLGAMLRSAAKRLSDAKPSRPA